MEQSGNRKNRSSSSSSSSSFIQFYADTRFIPLKGKSKNVV
jgi:hypothetical protein